MIRSRVAVAVALSVTTAVATASAGEPKKKKSNKAEPAATTTAPAAAQVTVAAPSVSVSAPSASVNVEAAPASAPSEHVEVVAVGGEGAANRAGFSVAGQVGFLAGSGGYSSFALGARGGYTFPFHLYLGADATFYFAGLTVVSVAPEVGYDIGIGNAMVVRPYVGIGFVEVTGVPLGGGGAAFEIYPGGEFLYHVTPGFFVGGDVRVPIFAVSAATGVGFNLMGTVGYKF